jgi:hypothetical protein
MLIRRESLSIFCHVYEFIRKHRDSHVFIPKSVRHELEHIRNILPLLRSDMSRAWCPLVHASDASSFGLGVCTRSASLSTVSRFGRFSERWLFLLEDKIQARRAALGGPQKFDDPEHDNCFYLSDNQLLDIDSDNLVDVDAFSDIPASFLKPEHWSVAHMSRLRFSEFITRSEGRGLLVSIKHLLRSSQNFGTRALFLVDNMSLCLGVTRGRSSSASLIKNCRQVAALALASGCRFHVRWIPSELNIADGPSRGIPRPLGCHQSTTSLPHKDTSPQSPIDNHPTPRASQLTKSSQSDFGSSITSHITDFIHKERVCDHAISNPCPTAKSSSSSSGPSRFPSDDDFLGDDFRISQHLSGIPVSSAVLHRVGKVESGQLDVSGVSRCRDRNVLGTHVLEGDDSVRRQQDDCRPEVRLPNDQSFGVSADPPFSESSTFLDGKGSTCTEGAASMAGVHSDIGGPMPQERDSCCAESPVPVPDLSPAWIVRCPSSWSTHISYTPGGARLQQMGCPSQPFGKWTAGEDRRFRRCSDPGFPAMDGSIPGGLESPPCRLSEALACFEPSYIRMPQLSSSLFRNGSFACLSLLFEAWRSLTRPTQRVSISRRHQVSRPVAIRCQRSSLCEGHSIPQRDQPRPSTNSQVRPVCSRPPCRGLPHEHRSSATGSDSKIKEKIVHDRTLSDSQIRAILTARLRACLKRSGGSRRVFLELYAGAKVVSKCLKKLNLCVLFF